MSRHVVSVHRLPPEGESHTIRLDSADIADLFAERGPESVREMGPLIAELKVLPSHGDVFVLGAIRGKLGFSCVRCLSSFQWNLDAEFHVAFVPEQDSSSGEVELHREDLEVEYLPGEEIDLAKVVLDQLFLALPAHPVCSDDCRGLCPRCGVQLGRQRCECPQEPADPRFAVLGALRTSEGRGRPGGKKTTG